LASTGLSQSSFAGALGTSQPRLSTYLAGRVTPSARLLVRAQRIGEAFLELDRLNLMSSVNAAAAIRGALKASGDSSAPGDREALRRLLQARDHLRCVLADYPALAVAWQAGPRSVGRPEWDALLAAVTAHEFESAAWAAPSWSQQPRLREAWTYPSALLTRAEVEARTPAWLATYNLHIAERDLATA